MNYTQLKEFLSDSPFIYADVTTKELEKIPCAMYATEFNGIKYIGTNMEINVLQKKQIVPTEEELLAAAELLAQKTASEESNAVVEEPITEV
jgi:hypothetical protein